MATVHGNPLTASTAENHLVCHIVGCMRTEVLARVRIIAAKNLGFVPLLQAQAAGITTEDLTELVAEEVLEDWVGKDIWLHSESDFPEFPYLIATWVMLEPATPAEQRHSSVQWVASNISAAQLHGLISSPAQTYHFTTPKSSAVLPKHPAYSQKIQIHREDLEPTEIDQEHPIPCTAPLRTFSDLSREGNVSVRVLGDIAAKLIEKETVAWTELLAPAYDYVSKITDISNEQQALAVLLENSKSSLVIPELLTKGSSHDFT